LAKEAVRATNATSKEILFPIMLNEVNEWRLKVKERVGREESEETLKAWKRKRAR
jgi:hypothetical protein